MAPLLDAALIVKDEEHHLPATLEALTRLRPLLGEVCVYDTGSTDRSIEICEEAGCRVERGYWDGDFARARNAASAMTTATWVLHVDADERVVADREALRGMLDRATHAELDVLYFPIRSWDRGRLLGDAAIGRLIRAGTMTFVGRVHEHAVSIDGGAPTGAGVPPDLFLVQHVGYSGEGTLRRKSERNAAISDAEVAACRRSGALESELQLALIHRARSLYNLGENERARADLREVRSLPTDLGTRRYAGELLVEHSLADGDWRSAAALLGQLGDEGVDRSWLRWKTANLLAGTGDATGAWRVIKEVDNVLCSLGETAAPSEILTDRLRMALEAEKREDAVATALLLVTRHGRLEYVPMLLAAWAEWPARVPAELLHEQSGTFTGSIRDAIEAQGVSAEGVLRCFEDCVRRAASSVEHG